MTVDFRQRVGSTLFDQLTTPVNDYDYYRSRSRKRVSACALLLNDRHQILLVKPNYREGWLLPGGSVEANESPLAACVREVQEEVGIAMSDHRLLAVAHEGASEGYKGDCLRFIFFGGIVTPDLLGKIRLQHEELDEFGFFDLEQASHRVPSGLKLRLQAAADALNTGAVAYLES